MQTQPQQPRPAVTNGGANYQPRAPLSPAVPPQHQQLRSATLRPPQPQPPPQSQSQRLQGMLPRRAAQQGHLRSGTMLQGGPQAGAASPAIPALPSRVAPSPRSHFAKVQPLFPSLPYSTPTSSDQIRSDQQERLASATFRSLFLCFSVLFQSAVNFCV